MRNYTFQRTFNDLTKEWNYSYQTVSKYCRDLNKNLISLQNYIDFNNPNHIILNHVSTEGDVSFYNDDLLDFLGIVKEVTFQNETVLGVFLDKLYNGHIIFNNFGAELYLFSTEEQNEQSLESLLVGNIAQGLGIFKKANNKYEVISLDSVGAFYVVSNVENDGTIVFTLLSHATVEYGLNYLFSLTAQNARWLYYPHNETSSFVETSYDPTEWAGMSIRAWSWPEDTRILHIITQYQTVWTITSVISHEIYSRIDNAYEEVFCDEVTWVESRGVDKGSLSTYNINTNMNNNIGDSDILNMKVYLY